MTLQQSSAEIITHLNQHGAIPIPFNAPYTTFEAAHDAMTASIAELEEQGIEHLSLKLDPNKRGSRVGYKFASRDEGSSDNKIYFHYNPGFDGYFNKFSRNRHMPKTHSLAKQAKDIYDLSIDTARVYISSLEDAFPGITNEFFPDDVAPQGMLRGLQYRSNPNNNSLAEGHNDIGFFTLQEYESGPGLFMSPRGQDQNIPVEKHEGFALGFRGFQLHKLLEDMGFEHAESMLPDFHGVEDIPKLNHEGTRKSWVFFLDHPTKYYPNDWHDTHTKLFQ